MNQLHRYASLIALICAAVSTAAAPLNEDDPRTRRIVAELAVPTYIDIKNAPLQVVAEYLSDVHGVPFVLDQVSFDKADVDYLSVQFTLKENGVPLRTVLKHVLDQHKMSFMVKDHKILFTTPDAAKEWQKKYFGEAKRE
jgi:hypothetical protein